jgi:cytoskeletal protein RodZ
VGSFGDKLRKQREQRGIALDAISNTTKISTRMLRAIEEEDFDQLPGGVFNKGFVRAYARHVGLDEEEAVTDYLAALRESQIQAQTILPNFRAQPALDIQPPDRRTVPPDRDHHPSADLHQNDLRRNDLHQNDLRQNDLGQSDRGNNGHHTENQTVPRRNANRRREDRRQAQRSEARSSEPRIDDPRAAAYVHRSLPDDSNPLPAPTSDSAARVPWGKLAAALLLLTIVLAFWNLHRRSQPTPASQPQAASQKSPAPAPAPPASTPTPAASTASLTAGKALPTGPLVAAPAPNPNNAPSLAKATSPQPSPPATPLTSSTRKAAAGSSDFDDNPPVAKTRAPAANAAAAAPTFTLVIRATQTSWVSVVADDKPVLRETLIAPANTSVRASREIVVYAGNAGGITFLLKGKKVEAPGNEGEVRTYTFDSTGLTTSSIGQTPGPAH